MGDKPNWLFMVYMVASDNDTLDSLAVQDLSEMERGVTQNSSNGNVQVFVQVHRKWPTNPQRYRIEKPDTANSKVSPTKLVKDVVPEIKSPSSQPSPSVTLGAAQSTELSTATTLEPVNMGDQKTLTEFLLDAPEAKHYCLVLWGHSAGLGFGREHGNKLTLGELSGALSAFEDERRKRGHTNPRLELIGANTCIMAYAEAIFELRNCVRFMVASEVFVPFAGWPYQEILSQVTDQSPAELGNLIANRYVDFYDTPDRDERVAMTLLDLGQAGPLAEVIENLAVGIKNAIEGDKAADKRTTKKIERLQRIQDAFLINPAGQIRPALDLPGLACDLIDTCDEIVQCEGGGKAVQGRVSLLRDAAKAVEEVLPQPPDQLPPGKTRKLVLMHKRHPELSDLNGVGIFAPFVIDRPLSRLELEVVGKTQEQLKQKSESDYLALKVFKEPVAPTKGVRSKPSFVYGTWPDLVFNHLRPNQPAEIVDSAGLVRPAERSAVSHMVFAVDAAFRRLNRALPLSQARLVEQLKEEQTEKSRLQNLACFGPPNLRLARERSLRGNPKKVDRKRQEQPKRQERPRNEPTKIVNALQSIEKAFARVEQITRRVITDAQFGIGPAASPGNVSGGFDDVKPIGEGFVKPIGEGFVKPIGEGFVKPIGEGFAGGSIGDEFGVASTDDAETVGSRIAFATADQGLGALAVIHLFLNIARSFKQVELAIVSLEDEVATFLDPEFGAILSRDDFETAIEARIQRRFAVIQETGLQALRIVRRVLAHPTFGIGPGPSSIGRGDREALAAQAGLSRQRLLLL